MGVIVCDKESDSILDVRLLTAFSLTPFFSNYGQHMDKLMKKTNQPTREWLCIIQKQICLSCATGATVLPTFPRAKALIALKYLLVHMHSLTQ